MNWDMIINVGMFALGCCFVIVAMAQLMFGDFDDDEEELLPEEGLKPLHDCDDGSHDEEWEDVTNPFKKGLDQVQTDIDGQDNPLVASMMVGAASQVVQEMIDLAHNGIDEEHSNVE